MQKCKNCESMLSLLVSPLFTPYFEEKQRLTKSYLTKWSLHQIIFQTKTKFKLQIKHKACRDRGRIELYSIKSCGLQVGKRLFITFFSSS